MNHDYKIEDFIGVFDMDIHQIEIVKNYTSLQKLWVDQDYDPDFDEELSLDLSTIEPSVAGPKRPQDKICLLYTSPSPRD